MNKTVVYELLAEGFEEVEALTPVDMLRRAGIDIKTVSVTGSKYVKGSHGITVTADLLACDADEDFNMIILPGGLPGVTNLLESEYVAEFIDRAVKTNKKIAAICAAPLVLKKYSVSEGKSISCYSTYRADFADSGIKSFNNARVTTDGEITTAVAMADALAFSHELIRVLSGRDIADKVLCAVTPEL